MNPAIPALAAIMIVGVFVAPRAWRPPWIALGLAGIVLLSPALAIPDGIPSSAERLALFTPWQQTGPLAGNDNMHFDVAWQIQPWMIYLRDELRAGRLPAWNPHQFAGMGFWGNGQSAPLFPLHLIFVVLPNLIGWIALPWMRIMLAGLGTWALARELDIDRRGSLLAALIYPLSGLCTSWLLYPMANALAMVPWVFWAVERLAKGRGSIVALASVVGLQFLGGHPGTSAHTAVLAVVYLIVRVPGSRPLSLSELRGWARAGAAWVLGGLIAAAHLWPFIDAAVQSVRWRGYRPGLTQRPLIEVMAMLGRLVLPEQYGNPIDATWWGPRFWPATAIFVGAAALPLVGIGLAATRNKGRWDRRWLGVVAVLVVSLLAAYEMLSVGRIIQVLPVAGMAELRRLLFGVELGLALLAGIGLQHFTRNKTTTAVVRGATLAALAALALLAFSWQTNRHMWELYDLVGSQTAWSTWVIGSMLLVVLGLWLPRQWRLHVATIVVLMTAAELTFIHKDANPATSLARLYPRTGAIEFLQGQEGRLVARNRILRPNAALVYGLYDVRGDDPMRLARYGRIAHEPPDGRGVLTFDPYFRTDPEWLDRLDVRWVITEADGDGERPAWELAYEGSDARIWRRPSASGAVRWRDSGTSEGLRLSRLAPGHLRLEWASTVARELEIAEVHQRGWSAVTASGESIALETIDELLLGLTVGPGTGAVDLVYRPPGLLPGALLSLLGLLICAGSLLRRRRATAPT